MVVSVTVGATTGHGSRIREIEHVFYSAGMARLPPHASQARTRQAHTITTAAQRLTASEPLTDDSRRKLAALLHHLTTVRDLIDTHTWDALMRLAEAVEQPHVQHREGVGKLPDGWRPAPPRAL